MRTRLALTLLCTTAALSACSQEPDTDRAPATTAAPPATAVTDATVSRTSKLTKTGAGKVVKAGAPVNIRTGTLLNVALTVTNTTGTAVTVVAAADPANTPGPLQTLSVSGPSKLQIAPNGTLDVQVTLKARRCTTTTVKTVTIGLTARPGGKVRPQTMTLDRPLRLRCAS